MFTWTVADRSDGDSDVSVGGAGEQTRRARNREADRQTYRQDGQKEVSDICSGQLMTPG